MSSGFNVVMIYADAAHEWNCSQWRNLTPSNALNRAGDGWSCRLVHISGFLDYLNPTIQDIIAPADIIIIQRNVVAESVMQVMDYWIGLRNKPVAVDLDDAYSMLPWSNPAHKFWIERKDEWQGELVEGAALLYLEEGLRKCGALIAPNDFLLADWGHVATGYRLQNYAEPEWWSDESGNSFQQRRKLQEKRGLEDKIVIGWGGSVSHYDSWHGSGLYEAAERVSKRHPEVVWMICGNDKRVYTHLDVEQKIVQYGVPPQDWPQIVRTLDIGLAPLFGPYDQRRSWIKGIEFSLAGIPWVGTGGLVYKDVADTGYLVRNGADQWEDALEHCIANLAELQAKQMARRKEYEKRFIVDNNIAAYEKVFKAIIENYGKTNSMFILPGVVKVNGSVGFVESDKAVTEVELEPTQEVVR